VSPTAAGSRRYEGTWPGHTHQIRLVRAALREILDGCPLADDALLVVSELAANAAIHSASRDGGKFTVRLEVSAFRVRVEVDDQGGPWNPGPRDQERPHGLELIGAVAGPGNWGIRGDESGRTVWAVLVTPRS
jgi:serine/threonine-protein kinase RsbW